jgi:predicted nucleic acid-binding protein
MNAVFVDTSYFLALELANDKNHQAAIDHWGSVIARLPRLVTTSYVFDEVVTFLNGRGHHEKAAQVGQWILSSPSVQFIHVDEPLFYEGWDYLQKHQDKEYSLTDCISFVTMRGADMSVAFAFDHHFAQAGFRKNP